MGITKPNVSIVVQLPSPVVLLLIKGCSQSLDRASSTHIIFTDFSKAADSVPHERLLLKLEQIGIRGNIHAWIRSFLVHHQQRILFDGSTSEWAEVTLRVPQGSILGPLMFIIQH